MIPIRPEHIDATRHFVDAFDNWEREISAAWIVLFCQKRGEGWASFTWEDIEQFYQSRDHKNFWFNGLDENPHCYGIDKQEDGRYEIRPQFVARCYGASPAEDAQ